MKSTYNKIIYCVAGLSLLSLSSCEDFVDSLLDQKNQTELTEDVFWRNLEDCNKGLTAVYKTFSNQNIILLGEDSNRADLTWPGVWPAWTTQNEYYNHTFHEATQGVGNKWAALYEGIFRANQVIEALNEIKVNYTSEEDLKEWNLIMGQARFFRGLFHHYLNKTYNQGNVPIMDFVPSNESEFLMPCSSDALVKNFYRADLAYAESVLPVNGTADAWSPEDKNLGRVTSGAASTVLGYSYLYDKDYAQARTYLKKVIDNSAYALTENIQDNFGTLKEFNSESILEINYTDQYNTNYDLWSYENLTNSYNYTFAPGSVGGWGPTIFPSYWLMRDYTYEPVDKLNPSNRVNLLTDAHGDILYLNKKNEKVTTSGQKTYHEYVVLQKDSVAVGNMDYYLKKVEVDKDGNPIIADVSTLDATQRAQIYKPIVQGALPMRAYKSVPYQNPEEYRNDAGQLAKRQDGDCWEVYYDGDQPYRYKVHSTRASYSVLIPTEIDVPYYQNPQALERFALSNCYGTYRKYCNWETHKSEKDVTPNGRSAINVRLLRLADVYLMYAEALIEGGNGGDTQEALKYINRVRHRAGTVLIGSEKGAEFEGMATYQDTSDPDVHQLKGAMDYMNLYNREGEDFLIETPEQIMDHLMYKERPLELSVEGHSIRYLDLRRWGIAKERYTQLSKKGFSTWGFTYFKPEAKSQATVWGWYMDADKATVGMNAGAKFQYVDASANYSDSKAYFPIPNDEQLANPNISTVITE